jgi:photosystem II stability/assembly factor-like uncharacterized protein
MFDAYLGTTTGVYRWRDGGRTWERVTTGLTAAAFRCFAPDLPQPGAILAGAEPARLYRSDDGGRRRAASRSRR